MKRYVDYISDLVEGDFVIVQRRKELEYVKYNSSTVLNNLYKEDKQIISFNNESDAKTFCREENVIFKEKILFRKILALSLSVVTVLLLIIFMSVKYSIISKEITLRETYLAKEKVVKSIYNSANKILKDKKIIADTSAEKDKEYTILALNAKYSDKDPLFLTIQNADPKFNYELYKDLISSIEQTRLSYSKEEEELFNIYSIYRVYVTKPFNRWFVKSELTAPEPILTATSKETFRTGIESETTF